MKLRNVMNACETMRLRLPPDADDKYFQCLCEELTPIFQQAIAEATAEKDAEIMRLTAALIAISVLSSADLDYAEKVNAASAIASDTLHTPRPAEKEKKGES